MNLKNQLLSVSSQPSHPNKITLLRMRMFLFVTTTTNCNRFLMISTHLFNLYYPCRGFCWYHPPILLVAIKSNQHNFSITFSILGNITIKSVKEFTNTINIYQGWSVNNREVTINAVTKYRRTLKIQKIGISLRTHPVDYSYR